MRKIWKRALSVALTLSMVLGLVPVTALAADLVDIYNYYVSINFLNQYGEEEQITKKLYEQLGLKIIYGPEGEEQKEFDYDNIPEEDFWRSFLLVDDADRSKKYTFTVEGSNLGEYVIPDISGSYFRCGVYGNNDKSWPIMMEDLDYYYTVNGGYIIANIVLSLKEYTLSAESNAGDVKLKKTIEGEIVETNTAVAGDTIFVETEDIESEPTITYVYTDANGNEKEEKVLSEDSTFTMPASNVKVKVEYENIHKCEFENSDYKNGVEDAKSLNDYIILTEETGLPGGTYYLEDDADISSLGNEDGWIILNNDVEICLHGYELKLGDSFFSSGGYIKICNCSEEEGVLKGNDTIIYEYINNVELYDITVHTKSISSSGVSPSENGSLIAENCKFEGNGSQIEAHGKATIKNCIGGKLLFHTSNKDVIINNSEVDELGIGTSNEDNGDKKTFEITGKTEIGTLSRSNSSDNAVVEIKEGVSIDSVLITKWSGPMDLKFVGKPENNYITYSIHDKEYKNDVVIATADYEGFNQNDIIFTLKSTGTTVDGKSDFEIICKNGEYKLHAHNLKYAWGTGDNANVLTESCDSCEHKATVTVKKEVTGPLYDISDESTIFEIDKENDWIGENLTVTYFKEGESEPLEGGLAAINSAGDYKVVFTYKDVEGSYSIDFSVEAADVNVSVVDEDGNAFGDQALENVKLTLKKGEDEVKTKVSPSEGFKGLFDGEYTIEMTVAPSGYETAENVKFMLKDGKIEGANNNTVTIQLAKREYTVSVADNITNGSLAVDKDSAYVDDEITVTVIPVDGYGLVNCTLEYTYEGNAETISVTEDNKGTFTMPAANVTISARFAKLIDVDSNGDGEVKAEDNEGKVTADQKNDGTYINVEDENTIYIPVDKDADSNTDHYIPEGILKDIDGDGFWRTDVNSDDKEDETSPYYIPTKWSDSDPEEPVAFAKVDTPKENPEGEDDIIITVGEDKFIPVDTDGDGKQDKYVEVKKDTTDGFYKDDANKDDNFGSDGDNKYIPVDMNGDGSTDHFIPDGVLVDKDAEGNSDGLFRPDVNPKDGKEDDDDNNPYYMPVKDGETIISFIKVTPTSDGCKTDSGEEYISDGKGGFTKKEPVSDPGNNNTGSTTGTSSNRGSTKYNIVIEDALKDVIKSSHSRAKKGTTITLTVIDSESFDEDMLKVLERDGDIVDLKDNGDGTYTFKMPTTNVTVTGTFADGDVEEDLTTIVLTIDSKIIWIDDEMLVYDVAPVIRNDRTVLPIRVIVEALGATVTWNEAEQKVTITKDDTIIELFINQPFALVNGEPVKLDAPAFIENDRTYLPLRFIMENIGAEVTWDDLTRTVTIVG